MKKEYKKFVVNYMYLPVYSSNAGIETHMNREFKRLFGIYPEKVLATTTKDTLTEQKPTSFIGAIEVSFTIDGETFILERDYGEEYGIDKNHPDYETDDYFYEGDKCYSVPKRKKLLQLIDANKL